MPRHIHKWTPKEVDSIFDELANRLGRVPTYKELRDENYSAINFITRGRYNPEIRTFSGYLLHRELPIRLYPNGHQKRIQPPQDIDKIFDDLKGKLGRLPTAAEFHKESGTPYIMWSKGKYSPAIHTWSEYVRYRGYEDFHKKGKLRRWNSQEIDDAFDSLRESLGRIPTMVEFGELYNGALSAIIRGRYDLDIHSWRQYMALKEIDLPRTVWTPEAVDQAFDDLKEKLGRVPSSFDFTKRFSGARGLINGGRYHPSIQTWNAYLRYRGFEVENKVKRRWAPATIDKAFDELVEDLGRIPTSAELKQISGAIATIVNGKYRPDIHSYNEYLQYRGFEIRYDPRDWSSPASIDDAFDSLREELGRVPRSMEFRKLFSGATLRISQGKYNPSIRSWRDYLRHRGFTPTQRDFKSMTNEEVEQYYQDHYVGLDRKELRKLDGTLLQVLAKRNLLNQVIPVLQKKEKFEFGRKLDVVETFLFTNKRLKEIGEEYGIHITTIIGWYKNDKILRTIAEKKALTYEQILALRNQKLRNRHIKEESSFQEFLGTNEAQTVRDILGAREELSQYLSVEEQEEVLQATAQTMYDNLDGQKSRFSPERLLYLTRKLHIGVVQKSELNGNSSLPYVLSRAYHAGIITPELGGRVLERWLDDKLIDQARTPQEMRGAFDQMEKELMVA